MTEKDTHHAEMTLPAPVTRGQLEWALWRIFRTEPSTMDWPPRPFRTRILRLLDLDRRNERDEESVTPHHRYAFFDTAPEGRGVNVRYSPFNGFCVAIGLDLMDIGFKQSEVVFLLKHVRRDLEGEFNEIVRNPPAPRQLIGAEDRPGCPVIMVGKLEVADCRRFMLLERVELKEIHLSHEKLTKPIIIEPKFFAGVDALRDELDRSGCDFRKMLVFEMAEMAVMLCQHLTNAPEIKRGPKG